MKQSQGLETSSNLKCTQGSSNTKDYTTAAFINLITSEVVQNKLRQIVGHFEDPVFTVNLRQPDCYEAYYMIIRTRQNNPAGYGSRRVEERQTEEGGIGRQHPRMEGVYNSTVC